MKIFLNIKVVAVITSLVAIFLVGTGGVLIAQHYLTRFLSGSQDLALGFGMLGVGTALILILLTKHMYTNK